jgi:hypothetical protein
VDFLTGVQRLHSETGRSTAAPTSVVGQTGRILRLVNAYADAWIELQSEHDWRWMRGTTDAPLTIGVQKYSGTDLGVASRFGRWRHEDDSYWPRTYVAGSPNSLWNLQFQGLDNFRDQWVYIQQGSSSPVCWTIDENENILLGPAPAVAYMIRADYLKEPFALVLDVDTPDLPDRFQNILVWRALMDVSKSGAAPEVLARAEQNYRDLHDKLLFDQARLPML